MEVKKVKKIALVFALILMIPMFSQIRGAHATSCGYERYVNDVSEVYVEYFPLIPYDPNFSTASEEFPIKFYIEQESWDEYLGLGMYQRLVPGGWCIDVSFRDDTSGDIWISAWKRWYPTSMNQIGYEIEWSVRIGVPGVPLYISGSVDPGDFVEEIERNYDNYNIEHGGKVYNHLSYLKTTYYLEGTPTLRTVDAEGGGSMSVPNDLATSHNAHHILVLVRVSLIWHVYRRSSITPWIYWGTGTLPYSFVLGDDIPTDTDCWLAVEQGDTSFSVYTGSSGGGGGECPTLFVWNGTHYADEGVLDIHAESDITVRHEIQNALTLKNGLYNLELRELDNFTSHLDQVKLYAMDDQGEWHLCPLVYANHDELGWVTWKLLFDDENRVDMTPTQKISLRFLPSIPYSETTYFIFEIDGHNRKALY
jgi:hypothetical protein